MPRTMLDLEFKNWHLDTIGGPGAYEHKYRMLAVLDGKNVGGIDYTVYQDEVHIDWIEVSPHMRRKGIGRALVEALEDGWPGASINWGMTTPWGTALRESLEV